MTEALAVAKKRANKPGPKAAPPEEQREELVAIRCTAAWKKWLHEQAKAKRTTVAILLDQAVARVAELDGDDPPPPR